ncbi:hypothetical protein BHU72_02135 [Desulfuribacillus stibiiarsenatis]|uniref:Uncharacterized protein n=1 Tax=Desulfuribacillus stibiiarsenatis TaxID=1390249 RepID=A0A1E5L684_9FIRM|nr:hypothetical protein [Desulfuribacillus stibiiarsenatis]OEH85621.1 hypothetical protein BHU72_02135 [Desulfuribacillus stibiiarsenatis]
MYINNRQGKVLPIVLTFTILLQTVTSFMLSQITINQELVEIHKAQVYADYAGESGFQMALSKLSMDSLFTGNYVVPFDATIWNNALIKNVNIHYQVLPIGTEHVKINVTATLTFEHIEFPVQRKVVARVNKTSLEILRREAYDF